MMQGKTIHQTPDEDIIHAKHQRVWAAITTYLKEQDPHRWVKGTEIAAVCACTTDAIGQARRKHRTSLEVTLDGTAKLYRLAADITGRDAARDLLNEQRAARLARAGVYI